jgi:subtilase family serine protease
VKRKKEVYMKFIKILIPLSMMLLFYNTISIAQENNAYDIKAISVEYKPNIIVLNKSVVFTYRIENCGNKEIPQKSYDVEFYIDDKLVNFDYATPRLKIDKGIVEYSTEGDSKYLAKQLGKHSYKLIVDPKNRLREVNKSNNIIEGIFVVEN